MKQRINEKSIEQADCFNCGYFYGKTNGEYYLNCANHPYGPPLAGCSDWLKGTETKQQVQVWYEEFPYSFSNLHHQIIFRENRKIMLEFCPIIGVIMTTRFISDYLAKLWGIPLIFFDLLQAFKDSNSSFSEIIILITLVMGISILIFVLPIFFYFFMFFESKEIFYFLKTLKQLLVALSVCYLYKFMIVFLSFLV